jgi:RNase P protein component
LIREWFRRDGRAIDEGRDVVVIARPGAARLAGLAAFADLNGALRGAS